MLLAVLAGLLLALMQGARTILAAGMGAALAAWHIATARRTRARTSRKQAQGHNGHQIFKRRHKNTPIFENE
ncbi:MAG: hypothetical protein J0L97_07635 [Alphaproteobacteria bacterium]|nr:hypothetical protein [Alphaproteobacteria bacterium]